MAYVRALPTLTQDCQTVAFLRTVRQQYTATHRQSVWDIFCEHCPGALEALTLFQENTRAVQLTPTKIPRDAILLSSHLIFESN